ncbi:glycerate kinase [soil metagenome]
MSKKNPLRFLVAPNTLKGSINAVEAAEALRKGIERGVPGAIVVEQPIADGGELTTEILVRAMGGVFKEAIVRDPLGREVKAKYGLVDDGKTGVLELAAASGMRLLKRDELNPMRTSTFGTGQLISAILDQGCKRIILGLGNSATVDAGTGILKALGIRLTERNKSAIPLGGSYLHTIVNIDMAELDIRIHDTEIVVLCDVENTLLGKEGAAHVFAPQKGATGEQVQLLEENMEHFSKKSKALFGFDLPSIKHGGAAGGVAATLAAYLNAKLVHGTNYLLEVTGTPAKIQEADFVFTAEGRLDEQTLKGKGPHGLAQLAKDYKKPVICFTGSLLPGFTPDTFPLFHAIISLPNRPMTLHESMHHAAELLEYQAMQAARLLNAGR